MTLAFDSTENTGRIPERRKHPRHRVAQMVYIKVGEGNGGFILNISEAGLAVQAAMALIDDDFPSMRFHFAKSKTWIEASGVVAWKSESKKVAGIRFVDLSEESRIQINDWIEAQRSGVSVLDTPDVPAAQNPLAAPAHEPAGAPANAFERESKHQNTNPYLNARSEPLAPLHGADQGGSAGTASPTAVIREDVASAVGARALQTVPDHEIAQNRPDAPRPRRLGISKTLLKRYLVDERHRIRLYDLVSEKAEKLCSELTEANFPSDVAVTDKEFERRVHRYEELTEELVSIFITGCFWGEKNQELIWVKLLERTANTSSQRRGRPQWLALQSYPALLLLYAGGVAAIANEKYSTLESLLVKPRLIGPDGDCRLVDKLSAAAVIEDDRLIKTIGGGPGHAALSGYLCSLLREQFREFVPSDDVYDEIFDHFEYLFSLVWIDENPIGASLGWVPLGRFAWRQLSGFQSHASVIGRISAEASQQGKDWPVFRAGLFGGSMQRFLSARNRVATFMASQR